MYYLFKWGCLKWRNFNLDNQYIQTVNMIKLNNNIKKDSIATICCILDTCPQALNNDMMFVPQKAASIAESAKKKKKNDRADRWTS